MPKDKFIVLEEIENGSFTMIVGESGSGKSTLLNIIGGMDVSTNGNYFFEQKNICTMKKNQLEMFRKENISFVFQNFALLDKYTVFENIEIPLIAKNMKAKKRKQIIAEKMEMLRISELEHAYPRQLSGGQQQRTALARALAMDSKVILADEPTGALDKENAVELMNVFKEINEQGKTIIMVTHNENLLDYAKMVIRLEDGKIVS